MSLIPAFELGVWNAWILVLTLFVLVTGLTPLITKVMFTSSEKSADTSRQHNPAGLFTVREKKLYNIGMVITFASYIYSIFVPLKLGTTWFYVGFLVYLTGVLFGVMAQINFAQPPLDEPATRGVYAISRNPMYLGTFLVYIGIGFACISLIYLLLAILFVILDNKVFIIAEERWCLEKYGDDYRDYMDRTPRWIGIPKSQEKMKV